MRVPPLLARGVAGGEASLEMANFKLLLLIVVFLLVLVIMLWFQTSTVKTSKPLTYSGGKTPNIGWFVKEETFIDHVESGLSSSLNCPPGALGLYQQNLYEPFVRALENYTKSYNLPSNHRTLTWQCRANTQCSGGLADRLRGVSYSLLMAIITQRRLQISWDDLAGQYLYPHMIDWMTQKGSGNTG